MAEAQVQNSSFGSDTEGPVSGFSWSVDKTEREEMFAEVPSKSGLDLNGTVNTGTAN